MSYSLMFVIASAFCEAAWNIFLTKSKGVSDWGINLLGIAFLIIGIVSFKKALSGMPLSVAIVIWSGLSLLLTILFDVLFFKTRIDFKTAFFMMLCILSILGLNYYSKTN